MCQEILKFTKKSGKGKNRVDVNMKASCQILTQCHDVVAQSHSCQQEMQENRETYFHNI